MTEILTYFDKHTYLAAFAIFCILTVCVNILNNLRQIIRGYSPATPRLEKFIKESVEKSLKEK